MVAISGCDGEDNNNPVAQLTAMESPNVPGRMELDGVVFLQGERKLVSHLYSNNLDTGETVYGPVTIQERLDRGPIKVYPYTNVKSTGVKGCSLGNYKASRRSALRTMWVSRTPQRQLSQ